jgi:hypothetical protein
MGNEWLTEPGKEVIMPNFKTYFSTPLKELEKSI